MSDDQDPEEERPNPPLIDSSDEKQAFLRDEGLEMLQTYRRIRDVRKRELILELAQAIAEDQSKTDGH